MNFLNKESEMFKKKIVGIELGNSNSILRTPFAHGKLECGHLVSAGENKHRQTCSKCETSYIREEQNPTKENGWKLCPNCGHNGSKREGYEVLSVHSPENQTVKIGDEFDCKDCAENDKNLKFILENREKIMYARFKTFCGRNSYLCYQRDNTSPSGVKLFAGVEATKEVQEVFFRIGLCTLSPTEGLYAPSKYASGYNGI